MPLPHSSSSLQPRLSASAKRPSPQHASALALTPSAIAVAMYLGLAGTLVLGSVAASPVAAQTATPAATQRYAIAAGSLESVLTQFLSQSGVLLAADPQLTQGVQSPGLQGSYDVRTALASLLNGTGLQAVPDANGGYALRLLTNTSNASHGSGTALPEVVVTAANLGEATEGSNSYVAQAVAVGNKTAQSLRETPRSISVLTRQQLNDQQIQNVDSALEQMSGVTVIPGSGLKSSQYYARGHQITNFSVDGSPGASYHANDTTVNAGMAKYDNIQLMRGPDGLFSGSGGPSGTINMVRKRPTDQFRLTGTGSIGRWSNYYGDIDVGGPLNEAGTLRGRFVAAHNDREYFYDGAHRQISTLYGIVEADITPDTVLSFGASFDREGGSGRSTPPGFPRYSNGVPLPVPRSQGYTSWSFADSESKNAFATLEHSFNADWKARVNASHTVSEVNTNSSSYVGSVNPITGLGAQMFPGSWAESDFTTTTGDAYVSGRFNALGRQHQVLVGGDYRHSNGKYWLFSSTATQQPITDWSYVDPNALLPHNSQGNPGTIASGKTKQIGLYANLKSQIYGPLHAVIGGRYASYEYVSFNRQATEAFNPKTTNKSNSIFTPYYALTLDLSDTWTTYFSTSRGYQDQSNYYTADLEPLSPSTSRSYELGIKGELLDGRLNASAAVYRSTRDNYAVRESTATDFDVPGRSCCWRGDGKFLAQGIELDIGGEVAPGWQVSGGYTFDDNKTEYGSADGQRFASYTPKHILRLWTSYQLREQLSGWKIGGGVRAQTNFFRNGTVSTWNPTGGTDGTGAFDGPSETYAFTEPGRAIWSTFVEYRFNRNWTAALNIDNLFDKTYFQSVGDTRNWYNDGSFYGEPRNVRFTIRGTF
ncbi:TonB-dependent siderophore receptor [Lampropedia puyangensis]|uniref:TonB-dependent siderophore receptor n=1 Tax=Lampropedia puyangensis TaxID=1330072 RepID=A0A4S8FGW4_9BURK|nr:TonB-dependent receptor [Lampropedia puyangensis]THU05092.1 TonB-dependent siderophore receptor [Lampropedia puyangensis]